MMNYLKKIFELCSYKKGNIVFLAFLYLLISLLDIMGIALIGSFITLIISPNYFSVIFDKLSYLNITELSEDIFYVLGILTIIVFTFKTIIALVSYNQIINFSFEIQSIIRKKIMNCCTKMNYEDYTNLDTSKYTQMTGNMVKTFGSVLNALLQTIGDFIIFFTISIFLIYINYKFYLIIFFSSIIFFTIYKYFFLNKLLFIGEEINKNYTKLYKNLKEFFKGFKEIKILKIDNFFLKHSKLSAHNIAKLDIKNSFITFAPKYFLELFFIILIVLFFLFSLKLSTNTSILISTGTFFVASIVRLIPSLLQFVRFKSTINLGKNSIEILYEEIINLKDVNELQLKNKNTEDRFDEIEFKNVSFKYLNNDLEIFKNLNFKIEKNSFIGISGPSGCGKSTLVDLLTGLIKPTHGEITLNKIYTNKEFYKIIDFAYISQKPFLLDDDIKKNITISNDNINDDSNKLLKESIKIANIGKFIKDLPQGLDTNIGEDGAKISGGQKQRVAIARALYHDKNFIILDEPTSSLDSENAEKIIKELIVHRHKYKNVIIISHSKNILNLCDHVLKIDNKTIRKV